MRSRSIVIPLAVAAVGTLLSGVATPARSQDTRPGIAVFMFDNGGSFGQDKKNLAAWRGASRGMLNPKRRPTPAGRWAGASKVRHRRTDRTRAPPGPWAGKPG